VTEQGEPALDEEATKAETPGSIGLDRASSASSRTFPSDSRVVGSSGPSIAVSATRALTTAAETMRLEEIMRTRMFVRLALSFAAVVAIAVPFVGGDPRAKIVLWLSLVPVIVTCGWLWRLLRDEDAYTVQRALICGYTCIAGAFGGIYFFGFFSPAPIILPFGLYFFSSGQDFRATLAVYLTCAIGYAALTLSLMLGVLPDLGLIEASHLTMIERSVILVLVEGTLLITFLSSRATRASTLAAIERHDRVVRSLAQREALLKEARQDLERALRFNGMGRFSDTVIGSFRLGTVIGRGAMGEVYAGAHVESQKPAAVKLLHGHALADPDLLKRFLREAKLASSLDTPHVVKVLEIGGLEAQLPFIAMELLRGEDLADHLRRHRQLSMKKTITLVRHVGRGLEVARAAGIVHRDLKPRNLFYTETGEPEGGHVWKILDFGISKLNDAEATQQTKDMIVGTPGYMAPEQAAGRAVDHRTDLFALGVIAYRCLTGRPPFTGDHMAETLFQVTHAQPPAPSELVTLHADVDLVIAIAIAKQKEDRFDSGAQLAAALDAASRGELEQALRDRAARLLAKHPWGTRP
jgi:serine/threonine-protein kinase